MLCKAFMLQFWFVMFCKKEISEKAACKMLVKLTREGINLIQNKF